MNAQAYTTSSIIVRKLNNAPAVFVLSGLDLDQNVIPMWDGTNNEPTIVPLQMYKDSKPAGDVETDALAIKFRERFLPTGSVQIRSRLAKDMAKMYADHAKQKEEGQYKHVPVANSTLNSPTNITAQRREATPAPSNGSTLPESHEDAIDTFKRHLDAAASMGNMVDKQEFAKRVMDAFGKALVAAMTEAMK